MSDPRRPLLADSWAGRPTAWVTPPDHVVSSTVLPWLHPGRVTNLSKLCCLLCKRDGSGHLAGWSESINRRTHVECLDR